MKVRRVLKDCSYWMLKWLFFGSSMGSYCLFVKLRSFMFFWNVKILKFIFSVFVVFMVIYLCVGYCLFGV